MGMTNDGLSYWQAEHADISLLNTTVGDLLDLRAAQFPDKEAVVYSGYPEFADLLTVRSPGDCWPWACPGALISLSGQSICLYGCSYRWRRPKLAWCW
ncbi:MAG TPA: hypothetical protein VGF67_23165 [Ktedonobacteraceae bacterium]|jgi:hypothetical protein